MYFCVILLYLGDLLHIIWELEYSWIIDILKYLLLYNIKYNLMDYFYSHVWDLSIY